RYFEIQPFGMINEASDNLFSIVMNDHRQPIPWRRLERRSIKIEYINFVKRTEMGNTVTSARHPLVEKEAGPLFREVPTMLYKPAMAFMTHNNA
ncbi:hypothetical protein, partial [Mesorhizobium sp. M2D.F.Ca.ET.206.01.1.1]|uniref:hypothetical protein n=1 Tax=Mesorhizobium sp. M2D.F.Ca.ET.206.01.1.1 TaxID=2563939 RepID=UPI001AEEAADA